jgi:hypothetical protein
MAAWRRREGKTAMDSSEPSLLISIGTAEASDSWGFVGTVSVGEQEAYRTIRAYPAPSEALAATQQLLAQVLGSLMAGQEWRSATDEHGHAARRTELAFGLDAHKRESPSDST